LTQQTNQRWKLSEVPLGFTQSEDELRQVVAGLLQIRASCVSDLAIVRRGIDARHKGRVLRVYTLEFDLLPNVQIPQPLEKSGRLRLAKPEPAPTFCLQHNSVVKKVIVVGMGPAGLFAALELARSGHAVTLLERGASVEQRAADVEMFWRGGPLNSESNVQFGEGGAGTFSDGKLTTRVKHPFSALVLDTFIACGAPEDIRINAKPHIGTDVLRNVLVSLRNKLRGVGVNIRFHARLSDLNIENGVIRGVVVNDSEHIHCDAVVLAIGHSARDTYAMLQRRGVALEPKPFAIGVRVEHPTELINSIQYGAASHPQLPAAEYALSWNDRSSGRGVYSFCMCPGGEVVLSSSEENSVVVNGMSRSKRDAQRSNSALVVSVNPEDFGATDPLAGVEFQRYWERKSFNGNGDYRPPAQNMLSFLQRGYVGVSSSCRPGVREENLRDYLPPFVYNGLLQALPQFERKMKGFITAEASLIALESRTSAPVRILRSEQMESLNCRGLYPVGEGAGYAGGIMSAALDGLKVVQTINALQA